jgi:hypothetical protein
MKDKAKSGDVIRVRIITPKNGGLNIMIPMRESVALYEKYRDLRTLIRNSDTVLVTFPELYLKASPYGKQLFLLAYDFKVRNPEETAQPKVYI